MSKKRILFVSYTAEMVGPSFSLLQLLEILKEQYAVSVMLPQNGPFVEFLNIAEIDTVIEDRHNLHARSIPNLWRHIRQHNVDLVFGNTHSRCCRNALIAARLASRPFIWHIRSNVDSRPVHRLHAVQFMPFANAIIAVSESSAASIRPYTDQNKICIVNNGIPVDQFGAVYGGAREALRRQLQLDPDQFVIITVGNVDKRKAHEYLISAMSQLVHIVPQAVLLITGRLDRDPAHASFIRDQIQERSLQAHVKLLGFRNDLADLLSVADVYAHTALMEGHCRAVLEAMGAELPVVAFDTGGVRESIQSGKSGYLVPQKDVIALSEKIGRLARTPALIREMGSAGRTLVEEHFSDRRMASEIGAIIESTFNK